MEIGIVSAMEEEIQTLLHHLENKKKRKKRNAHLFLWEII